MTEENRDSEPKLPPKLDLRKSGILKSSPNPVESVEDASAISEPPVAPATSEPAAAIPDEASATPAPTATPAPRPSPKPVAKPIVPGAQNEAAEGGDVAASKTSEIPTAAEKVARPMPVAAKPVTIKATPVAAIGGGSDAGVKKSTTKIALDAARLKTIKGIPKPVSAGEPAPVSVVPKPKGTENAEKRKTSRISLESVLGEDQESGEVAGAPKTIRLKRPGAEGAPKLATQAKTVKAVKRVEPEEDDAKAETSEAAEGESQTRKKTVVVKRRQGGGGKKLKVARPKEATGTSAQGAAPEEDPAAAPAIKALDQPGTFFSVVAIAATLVVLVTLYMLVVQVIGPNFAMTDYSHWKDGPELAWPGKLSHR